MSNAKAIWDYLKNKGLNDYAVAGILGNLREESGLKPDNLQNSYQKSLGHTDESYTRAVDNGGYNNFVKDCAGYGLAQWTYWTRKQALLNYAKAYGSSIGNLTMQLGFLWQELQGYKGVMQALKTATSVRAASDAIMLQYERPADQSEAARKRRAGYGQEYYDIYAGKGKQEAAEPTKSVAEVAQEVLNGIWGNGTERKQRLEAAGYDYKDVQAKVNELVKKESAGKEEPANRVHKVQKGDTLSAIARKYNATVKDILAANKAKYPKITANYIVVGWELEV